MADADAGGGAPPAAGDAAEAPPAPRFQGDLTKVRVVLRVRPLLRREYGYPLAAERLGDTRLRLFASRAEILSEADAVLDENSTQDDVFSTVADVVAGALRGCNGTIFAYGQTGTGKTYTMLGRETPPKVAGGPPGYAVTGGARGIIPRAVEALLAGCEAARADGWTASLSAVYLQQYGERLFDLRHPLPSAAQPWGRDKAAARALAGLELRPEPGGGVAAAGAEPAALTTLDDVAELLRAGAAHRALRATELNDASSRSHAILQIVVEMTRDASAPGGARYRRAKLNLVDLAGSEKWAPGEVNLAPERVAELCAINASLAALGACVRALGTGSAHVPARDSKLTRLLADALGGGALTALVATLSPSALSYDESASTLRFADAAGRVQVTARPAGGGGDDNGDSGDAVAAAAAARAEVARLTALLRSLTGDDDGAKAALEADNARLRKELAEAKKAEKAAARRAADAARVAAAAGVEKAAAERAAAEAAAKRPAAPRRAASAVVPQSPPQSQPPGGERSADDGGDDDAAVLAALRPSRGPSRLPRRDISSGSTDTRLSAGWSSDLDDSDAPGDTPQLAAGGSAAGPGARGSGGSGGSGGASSAAWLAEYAEAKRAAAAAAAAARAARADGGWRGSSASGGRPGAAPAAWEEAPFFSKRAPTPPAPGLTATSSSRSLRSSSDASQTQAAVPASTVRARGIYGGGAAAAGVSALSASQRLAAAKARAGGAVTPPARGAATTPPQRNAATAPAGRAHAAPAPPPARPAAAKAPVAQASSPQRTRVRAASGATTAAAAAPAAQQPRATAPPPRAAAAAPAPTAPAEAPAVDAAATPPPPQASEAAEASDVDPGPDAEASPPHAAQPSEADDVVEMGADAAADDDVLAEAEAELPHDADAVPDE